MTQGQKNQQQSILSAAYREHWERLNRYASFKLGNHMVSEDLVQETFMKTWRYLIKGGKIATMKSFLYHILNNLIVDEYRKRKNTSLDALLEKGIEPGVDHSESLFNAFDGKTALLLMQRLPAKYRKTMRMRYIQSLSLAEISLVTGQSRNTVAVQIHRGLAKLKSLYTRAVGEGHTCRLSSQKA